MRPNYKYHAAALLVICTIITILFFLFGPKQQQQQGEPVLQGDRYIEIYSATWGKECNDYIQQLITTQNAQPAQKNEKGELIKKPLPQLVTADNALPGVSSLCNGKLTCEVPARSDVIGVEPTTACSKTLHVSYRCFAYDRLWETKATQGNTLKIDCSPDAATPKTSTPAAK